MNKFKELKLKKFNSINYKFTNFKLFRRNDGIVKIQAKDLLNGYFALGFIHAMDRQTQLILTRTALQGRLSEIFADKDDLISIDLYIKKMNFFPDIEEQIRLIEPDVLDQLNAYKEGINTYFKIYPLHYILKLSGYTFEEWKVEDSLMLAKTFGYMGLGENEQALKKLIALLIKNEIEEEKLKELFPSITENIDYKLIKSVKMQNNLIPEMLDWLIPEFKASNNWAIASELSETGKPILAADPHLEINRLPGIWYEVIIETEDNFYKGVTLPGAPGIILGRNKYIAWSATYSFMSMVDYKIEKCKNGKYYRNGEWREFKKREIIIKTRQKRIIKETVFENDSGILEGNPEIDGYYLLYIWSAWKNCGASDINNILKVQNAKNVKEAMNFFKNLDASPFNFVIADTHGNIGYQMSGRVFKRKKGISGLIPLPAWEQKYDYEGFVSKDDLPSLYNPSNGYIITANNDLNMYGKENVIKVSMGNYRAKRIEDLIKQKLKKNNKISLEDNINIQLDLYSIQAEKFVNMFKKFIDNSENGKILKNWNFIYEQNSYAPEIFERIYIDLVKTVFGENGLSKDIITYIVDKTPIFNAYFYSFDNILLNPDSKWYNGKFEEIIQKVITKNLKKKPVKYGKTRKVLFENILLGKKLPLFFKFDYGPISLPGSRATIIQGQIVNLKFKTSTFGPSYRFITSFDNDKMLTNIVGGVNDKNYSKYYSNFVKDWLNGKYKVI